MRAVQAMQGRRTVRAVPRRLGAFALVLGSGVLTGGVLACGSDSTLAPGTAQQDLETGFWSLTVNHQAVTLATVAPYDTIRLVATPRNAAETPLTGAVLDSVVTTYTLADPTDTSVVLTPDGVLRARYAHDGSLVLVRTQVRGRTRVDSVPVNVTEGPPPALAATLALSVTPDTITTVFGSEGGSAVTAHVLDGGGTELLHAAVRFTTDATRFSLQPTISGASTGTLSVQQGGLGMPPGRVWLVAEATVYGVTVRDSVPVTLTPPALFTLVAVFGTPKSVGHPVGGFEPVVDTLTIGTHLFGDVGALVAFLNPTTTPIDVVWDDPATVMGSNLTLAFCGAAAEGNIPAFVRAAPGGGFCGILHRQFGELRLLPVPGTYHYHSALYGTAGTIVVVPR